MEIEFWMDVLQMSYWFTFLVAAAATVYFILERGTATAALKPVGTTAVLVALITALQYFGMRDMVGFDGNFVYPTEYHFLGWLIIFPMLVLMVQKHSGMKREGIVTRVALATFVMVFAAWATEFHGYGWVGFWVTLIAWGFVAYSIHFDFTFKSDTACLKKYMVFGWLVFPIAAIAHVQQPGAEIMMWREALFVATDLVLVLGFTHCLMTAHRK